MSALAPQTHIALVEAFQLCCWARALLVRTGEISLSDAVDGLQDFALSRDLLSTLGQDAVQGIMAKAFSMSMGVSSEPLDREADLGRHFICETQDIVRRMEAADPRGRNKVGTAYLDGILPVDSLEAFGSDRATRAVTSPTNKGASQRLRFTPFYQLHISTSPRYLVKGIIPNFGLVVVWGAPKCGKSFYIFDMVAHIAAGWEYRERRVKQCPVVYFALEGQEGFAARVEAFRKAHDVDDIPFYLSADRIVLPQDGGAVVASIREQFHDVAPGVVVLDTLNRSIAGSENDPNDMGQYVRAADRIREVFNCVVIIIHHCGVEGARPRGHTSLTGAADAQIAVRRDTAENVVATVEFMKDGPQGAEIISSLEQVVVGTDDDGDDITSCVIRPAETSPIKAKAKVTGQAALALRILQDTIIEAGVEPPVNIHIPANKKTISEKTWRANYYAGMTTEPDSRQKAFVRASNKLQERNFIGKWGDHVWLV